MAPAADLKLPPPIHGDADASDATAVPNPKAAKVEDVDEITAASHDASNKSNRFASSGIIFPPPDIRGIVDKTAAFVARNGASFEAKIRGDERANTKFAFLNDSDPYHAYYKAKIQAVQTGEGPLAEANVANSVAAAPGAGQLTRLDGAAAAAEEEAEREERGKPPEPRAFEFFAPMPNITAADLDIIKLTALFTARKGRSFASALAAREGRSFQFEFLRPSHSLFGYFNRLVEQYRLVMEPSPDLLRHVRVRAFGREDDVDAQQKPAMGMGRGGGRTKVYEEAKRRMEWEKWMREKRKKQEDEEEKDRALFNEIDWQDFVVVGTVEMTEADEHVDLPPPMSKREVESMTLAQRRMAAMIMEEGADAEALLDELDGTRRMAEAKPAPPTGPAAATPVTPVAPTAPAPAGGDDEDMEMDESDDEAPPAPAPAAESAQEVKPPPAAGGAAAPIKIRKGYVPKTLAERKAEEQQTATTICPVCRQTVLLKDMDEHVRIELLNPAYRQQREELERKRSEHNALLEGADPSRFLKEFAGARTDIFGAQAEEEARRRREEEEKRKRREREKIVWDGHAASRLVTKDAFNRPEVLESQMSTIQRQFRRAGEKPNIGPQVPAPPTGPAATTPAAPPTGPAATTPTAPSGVASDASPATNIPTGPSAPNGASSPAAGVKRSAEGEPADQPAAQRPAVENGSASGSPAPPTAPRAMSASRPAGAPTAPASMAAAAAAAGGAGGSGGGVAVAQPPPNAPTGPRNPEAPRPPPVQVNSLPKREDGSLYAEDEWLRYNPYPVDLVIRVPDNPAASGECDGRCATFEKVPPGATMGSLRDRVHAELLKSSVGASRLKLKVQGRPATLKQTVAHWNLLDGDEVTFTLNK